MNDDELKPWRPGPPPEDLPKLFEAGYGQEKLAAHYGVTRHYVRVWLKDLDLRRAKGGGSKLPHRTDWPPPKQLLRSLIYNYSVRDIATYFGVANNSVKYWLDEYEIPVQGAYRRLIDGPMTRIPPPPRDVLVQEYVVKRRNAEDLAREYDVSSHVIARWLDKYEIPVFDDNHKNSVTARAYRERRRIAMPPPTKAVCDPSSSGATSPRGRSGPARVRRDG